MEIRLSDHFTYGRILRFTMPSVMMLLFTSLYGIVDGLFVSNFAGKTAFAAVNLIMPYVMLFGIVGFVFGTGGSALVAKTFGEGHHHRANAYFSLLTYLTIALGVGVAVVGEIFLAPVAKALGAEGEMLTQALLYARNVLIGAPLFVMQYYFQPFMIAAEKPRLNLWIVVAAGVLNMVLDALFVGLFGWGVVGAAWATILSEVVGGFVPLVYFASRNSSILRLGRTRWFGPAVAQSGLNGLSEFITNISLNVVSMLYNWQLLRLAGEDGVAAYGVIMYVAMLFLSSFLGICMGVSPVVSFHYGAENHQELKSLRRKSLVILEVCAIILTASAVMLARPISYIFVGYDEGLMTLTKRAFALYSLSFLIAPLNQFASAFFTALNNGIVSGAIAFSRMLLFQTSAVMLLPVWMGTDGVWLSMLAAEIAALAVSVFFFVSQRRRYRY